MDDSIPALEWPLYLRRSYRLEDTMTVPQFGHFGQGVSVQLSKSARIETREGNDDRQQTRL